MIASVHWRFVALCGFLFPLFGCQVQPAKPRLVETVAILPFDNESNEVDAADIMQRLVYLALKNSPYRVSEIGEVNAHLAKNGITEGGQLAASDPVKIGKDLNVQALIYGNVESFKYTNIGFYIERKVALDLSMIDASTGQTLWEHSGTGATRNVVLEKDKAKREFVKGLAGQMADKLFKSPLEEEAKAATIKSLFTLPGYRFVGFAVDEQTPGRGKNVIKGVVKDVIKNK